MTNPTFRSVLASAATIAINSAVAFAHDGPPFPIVSSRAVGAYNVSVWTDPDTTDDGTPGGQFWIMVDPLAASASIPASTRARVSIRPLDRPGSAETGWSAPERGDPTRQFAALVMDHEGRFNVHVAVEGPLGRGHVEADVDATYDLRPPPLLLGLYAIPFLLVGFLWLKLLLRRRQAALPGPS